MTIAGHERVARVVGSGFVGEPPTSLAARLRDLRLERGFTQEGLAAGLRTQGNRISDWENGIHVPTLTVLRRYAGLFGMSLSELLDGVS